MACFLLFGAFMDEFSHFSGLPFKTVDIAVPEVITSLRSVLNTPSVIVHVSFLGTRGWVTRHYDGVLFHGSCCRCSGLCCSRGG